MDAVTDSIAVLDVRILDAQIGNESARELGPLKYMATLTGQPIENIVNWFMLLIIFVFDPLAIAMVVAANMAFAHVKGVARDPKDYEVYQEKEPIVIEKEIREKYIKEEGDLSGPRLKSPEVIEKIVEKEVTKHDLKTEKILKNSRVQIAIRDAKNAGELR